MIEARIAPRRIAVTLGAIQRRWNMGKWFSVMTTGAASADRAMVELYSCPGRIVVAVTTVLCCWHMAIRFGVMTAGA